MYVSLLMYRMQEQIKIFQMVQQKIDSGEIPVHMLQVRMLCHCIIVLHVYYLYDIHGDAYTHTHTHTMYFAHNIHM